MHDPGDLAQGPHPELDSDPGDLAGEPAAADGYGGGLATEPAARRIQPTGDITRSVS